MDNQEKLARQWAKKIKSVPVVNYGLQANAAAEYILATMTPELETMADVEWDDAEHYLAGCMSPYGSVVMLRPQGANMIVHDLNSDLTEVFDRDDLTPNGKRYELREVAEAKRPEPLITEQDYGNAPEGTIVDIDGTVAVRDFTGWYRTGVKCPYTSRGMHGMGEGDVIRWGWGA